MGTGLKYQPVTGLVLIPPYLVEQVPGLDAERFFLLEPLIVGNPMTILGVFVAEGAKIVGFLWATVNPLDKLLHVNALSLDEAYRDKGIKKEVHGICMRVVRTWKLDGITLETTQPEFYEKLGFKAVRTVMEDRENG